MQITSVLFNAEGTGEQRRIRVGHIFEGRRVLAIGDSAGGVAVVLEGGVIRQIPAGSIVQVAEIGKPPPAARTRAEKPKKPAAAPVDPSGPIRGLTYSHGADYRTIRIGNTLNGHTVTRIIPGDPISILGVQDLVILQLGAGSVSRLVT